jgi:hypothetical protein
MNPRLISGLTALATVVLFAPLVPITEPATTRVFFTEPLQVREWARDHAKRARERLNAGDGVGAREAAFKAIFLGIGLGDKGDLTRVMLGGVCVRWGTAAAREIVPRLSPTEARAARLELEEGLIYRPSLAQVLENERRTTREQLRFYAKPDSPNKLWCQTVAFRWANDQLIADYDQAMERLIAAARTQQPSPAGPRSALCQPFVPSLSKVSQAYATETADLEALWVSLLLQERTDAP